MSGSNRRQILLCAAAALALPQLGSGLVHAATPASPASPNAKPAGSWPQRAIRLIVVYPAGGVSDGMARALAEPLSQRLGVPVLVDNRGGASGSVGMDILARAAPDGYTLAFSATSPLTLRPLLSSVPYDPQSAFVPVASVMRTPVLIVGTPAFTGKGFAAVIKQARQSPGSIRWATTGVATIGHMALVQTRIRSAAVLTHIPYQGGGPQLNEALSGQFEVLSTNVAAPQLRFIESGRLQALAVGSPKRIEALPDVPTLAELGYQAANRDSLFGIYAPAHTPAAVVQKLNRTINDIMQSDGLRARLRESYNLPAVGSSADFAHEIDMDRRVNEAAVKAGQGQFD